MAKKYVETYSSSNAAALYSWERVTKINLVTQLITQKFNESSDILQSFKTKLHEIKKGESGQT